MGGSSSNPHHQAGVPTRPLFRRGAKARITSNNAVLLVKEHHRDGTPFWTLPGGGVRPDESPTEGLRRELREELGCDDLIIDHSTSAERVWYAHNSSDSLVSVYTVFDCRPLSEPTANPTEGVRECRWARPESIPPRTLPQVRSICW